MGRQGRIKAARAAMKREGRKPEEIPPQPPSFAERLDHRVKVAAVIEKLLAEVKQLRAKHAEVCAERDDAKASARHAHEGGAKLMEQHLAAIAARDALRAQVENLEAARADLQARVEELEAEVGELQSAAEVAP